MPNKKNQKHTIIEVPHAKLAFTAVASRRAGAECHKKGSELRTQLYIAEELKILPAEPAAKLIDETWQLNRMMRALAKAQ